MRKTSDTFSTVRKSLLRNKLLELKHLFILMLCLTGISLNVSAAPSSLDLTFGSDGKVVSSPDGSELTFGLDYALQSNGKIIAVGGGANLGYIVARYNANGNLDTTFGNNGWNSVTFGEQSGSPVSVAIQPDGKIVLGGRIGQVVNNVPTGDFAVVRFNADGALDTTFDNDGIATVSFSPEVVSPFAQERFSDLEIGNDGKIIVAGSAVDPAVSSRFILARFNADGSLDTTFGTNGRVVDPITNLFLNDLTVLPDGSMVAVGSGSLIGTRIAKKYNVTGGADWTYTRSDGEFIRGGFYGIAAQADGKFVAVGVRFNRIVAVRLNADGTEDTSFNILTSLSSGTAVSAAIQADGKIVANYYPSNGWGDSRNSFNLIRFNADGTLDSGFGTGGSLNASVTNGLDYGTKVLIQPDGKILVGGYSSLSSPTKYYFSMLRFNSATVVNNRPLFDYDGDGKSDVSVFRPSNGVWYVNQSTNGFFAVQFGISTDRIVPADYDGDDKTDVAIFRDGIWWILQSSDNVVKAIQWGISEDKPQAGDFDGDGIDDLTVYRPSTGVWYILRSSDGDFIANQWGLATDIPQAADYDGDGRADIAVFRPSNGVWYIQRTLGGNLFIPFGSNGDRPVASDYDGDNRADIAVWRPATREWFILRSSNNQPNITVFGNQNDIPAPADYDGDGKSDLAVFRPSTGGWYQILSTQGSASQIFGLDGDIPTPNAFNQ